YTSSRRSALHSACIATSRRTDQVQQRTTQAGAETRIAASAQFAEHRRNTLPTRPRQAGAHAIMAQALAQQLACVVRRLQSAGIDAPGQRAHLRRHRLAVVTPRPCIGAFTQAALPRAELVSAVLSVIDGGLLQRVHPADQGGYRSQPLV